MTRFAAILCAAGLLAGCSGDPLVGVPRLSDTEIGAPDAQVALRAEPDGQEGVTSVAEAPQVGFFGRLFGGPEPDGAVATPVSQTVTTAPEEGASDPVPEITQVTEPPRRGLLGFLGRAAQSAKTVQPEGVTDVAAAPPQTATDALPAAPAPRNGPGPGAPDYEIIPFGTQLPFGVLARVCTVRNGQLGKRVERYPENRNTFAIYDSEPGNTAPHTFYVTGFKDGCVRQFTAALAMFGAPQTHELLRYGLPSKVQPYSTTDAAYEKLKSRVCRVGRGKPCGSAMSRLARNTAFVSVYERFGSNPIWKTILLHDGSVIDTDIRGN